MGRGAGSQRRTPARTPGRDAFGALLQVPVHPDPVKRDRWLFGRIIGLGHGLVCPRCGGGHYSFNGQHSICYQCNGRGLVVPRLTQALYQALQADVASGKFSAYLVEAQRQNRIRQTARGATARVMGAWQGSGVSEAYDWLRAAQGVEPDKTIADRFNKPMCDLYDQIAKQGDALRDLADRRTSTLAEREAVEAQSLQLAEQLATDTASAVARIEQLAAELRALLASRSDEASSSA